MAEGGSAMLKALVIGGTGATGKHVVGYLLKSKDKVDKVTVLGRRKLEVSRRDPSQSRHPIIRIPRPPIASHQPPRSISKPNFENVRPV